MRLMFKRHTQKQAWRKRVSQKTKYKAKLAPKEDEGNGMMQKIWKRVKPFKKSMSIVELARAEGPPALTLTKWLVITN